jgi:hypothetical protein
MAAFLFFASASASDSFGFPMGLFSVLYSELCVNNPCLQGGHPYVLTRLNAACADVY